MNGRYSNSLKVLARSVLGDQISDSLFFALRQHYFMSYANHTSLSQKITWYKKYGHLENYASYADKFRVRKYVAERIGEVKLVPLLGHYELHESIDFASLPKKFVIKATHGSHMTKIVEDKDTCDKTRIEQNIESWMKINLYRRTGEKQYRDISPSIVVEDYLEDISGELIEYKFFCFNGVPKYLHHQCNRKSGLILTFLDMDWNRMPAKYAAYPSLASPPPKPSAYFEMVECAATLADGFPFVRVDLYCVDGKIYFSELTFCPGNGYEKIVPREYDFVLGALFDTKSVEAN
jgi:hypothetical protein